MASAHGVFLTMLRRVARLGLLGATLLSCHSGRDHFPPPGSHQPPPAPSAGATIAATQTVPLRSVASREEEERWAPIDTAVKEALDEGKAPGCVVVIGRGDGIVFQKAYGLRALSPEREPMTLDTVFDLASLTKPMATASSVMVLADRGKIEVNAPVTRYVPELAKLPPFTVKQLLLHTSGLPAAISVPPAFATDRTALMRKIGELSLKTQPGERFLYSDVGFVVLEEIVRRASGRDLSAFAASEVYAPLGMKETTFLPGLALRLRAAPTEQRDGMFMRGDVHDPRAWALGGVAGHAGLFSTAGDVARFARALLGHGALDGQRVMSDAAFARWVTREETSKGGRALGWDVDSSFATHRSTALAATAFGHGGFTGTALWVDPVRDFFIVFLSNRVHPDGKGAVNPLIAKVATLALEAVDTKTGIDVLKATGFEQLRGTTIGVVTNASAKGRDGMTTLDTLRAAPNLKVAAIFTPEHGFGAEREGAIADTTYDGLPVHSLYGERYAPTAESLEGIDTLVFDLQDAGVRFYTYASTMKRAMKIAADRHLRFVVLDRPNPIDGVHLGGPVLAPSRLGFVNHHALPIRHAMTMGELARLFADDDGMDLRLDVVTMRSWRRKDTFDRTGLVWPRPSPNLRTVDQVILYPALGLLEGTSLSVGRGTEMPFEVIGAPWLDGAALARRLGDSVPGVAFTATTFTPTTAKYAKKKCGGVRVSVTDRTRFDPIRTGVELALALQAQHPNDWDVDNVERLIQSKPVTDAIRAGKTWSEIEALWLDDLKAFAAKRSRFVLYP